MQAIASAPLETASIVPTVTPGPTRGPFVPREPQSVAEAGLTINDVEALVLKLLLHQGALTRRQIAQHIRLPYHASFEVLRTLKSQMLLAYKASAPMGDFE